jgi:uncharacterized alkaline shock family protein YloU
MNPERGYGSITVSLHAIATVAARAARQSYGVVGMASRNRFAGLSARKDSQGVEVAVESDQILIDLYLVVEYGTRISSVATSVANSVQYQVERFIGLPVTAVNVHVQDLRVSGEE